MGLDCVCLCCSRRNSRWGLIVCVCVVCIIIIIIYIAPQQQLYELLALYRSTNAIEQYVT